MKKHWLGWIAVLLSFGFFLIVVPPLCAADDEDSGSDEFTLEEITVTAEKRAESMQKVAIAMDVISGEDLAEAGKMNVDDILSSLSNVMINWRRTAR